MIKLYKREEPEVLRDNAAAWLAILQQKVVSGQAATEAEKSRYRHKDIKDTLKLETSGKCAYCESYLLHVAFGDVEHITPKSSDITKTFDWQNLTLACDICNTYKSNIEGLVDPYVDDPDDHFDFAGPMIVARISSIRAVRTETEIKLNRGDLLEARSRRLAAIARQMLLIHSVDDPQLKQTLKDDLFNNEAGDTSEFAAFVRSFIRTVQSGIPGW